MGASRGGAAIEGGVARPLNRPLRLETDVREVQEPTLWPLALATAAKHRLYKSYLDAWWPIMLQMRTDGWRRPRVTYVDAFAGPGEYDKGEDGSPVFVLDRLLHHRRVEAMALSKDRVCLIFLEGRRDRYQHLCALLDARFGPLADLPVDVHVVHGEAGTATLELLDQVGAWGQAILAIFDSWGNVNVPLPVLERIAANKSSEALVTFQPNWFSRRHHQDPDQLDRVFGGREFWRHVPLDFSPEDRWRWWLDRYRDALARAGFDYQLSFELKPATGVALELVYGTSSDLGVEKFKTAMWDVDGSDGMSFRDPRTREGYVTHQASIFELAGACNPELLDLVEQRLAVGQVTLGELRRWLLLETARWLPKHATEAVKSLQVDGMIIRDPPGGPLTQETRLALRRAPGTPGAG